jgi:transglutaminase-like putative cysteine protease
MEPRQHRLSLDELHLLRWLLGGVLTLLSIATVFYLDVGTEVMTTLALICVLVALAKPELPALIPVWAHRLAFPAILAFFMGDLWHSGQLLPAVVRLDLLLLLYRGVSHRARRDDLQIVVLGLFLIVVAGVLTVSLLFAAQILVFTACALGFLMVVTIAASTEGGQAPKLAVRGVVPSWAAHAEWRLLFRRLWEVADWRLLTSAAVLFIGVVGISGLLFMAIPRFQLENSLFLERFVVKRSMTGFSDSIKFGDISEIIEDNSVAFDVDVSDKAQATAIPYWRMVVLDEYKNGGFRMSGALRAPDIMGSPRTASTINSKGFWVQGAPTWTVYMESGISRYLPLLGPFNFVRFRDAQNFQYSPVLGLIALRDEPATMTAYRVEGMAADSKELADPAFAIRWKNRAVHKGRGIPLQNSIDPSLTRADRDVLATIVADIGGATEGAAAFAKRTSTWLQKQHAYTLGPRIPSGAGDPLVKWMASREAGHCELFAGAFVLAARTAGYPARVVTGFKGGTWNGYSGNYTIRNSDAHAWAEVWDERRGAWLREDPLEPVALAETPKGDAAIAGLLDRSWAARFNSIRVFWYRSIVNFDQQSQVDTIKAVKAATDTSGKWLRNLVASMASRVKAWATSPWNLQKVARSLAAAAGVGAVLWILATGSWRFGAMGGRPRVDPVRREAGRWLRRIDGPPALVADLQRLRFGHSASWPSPSGVFRRARQLPASSRRRARSSSRNTS